MEPSEILCDECQAKIRPVVSRELQITASRSMKVHAVGAYNQPLISMILAKSGGNRTMARELGELVWDRSIVRYLNFDMMVPIPLHWMRYAYRGYNQADEIARVISAYSGKPIHNLLRRTRRTPFQALFKGDAKYENVKDAFALRAIDKSLFKNKKILLIDDVMTSGATLKYAAREILQLQPASLEAIVVSRAV